MEIRVHPKASWLVVEPVAPEERTEAGLFLPDTANKTGHLESALVRAVGPAVKTIIEGETIVYRTHAAIAMDITPSAGHKMIQEENVIGTIEHIQAP